MTEGIGDLRVVRGGRSSQGGPQAGAKGAAGRGGRWSFGDGGHGASVFRIGRIGSIGPTYMVRVVALGEGLGDVDRRCGKARNKR